jgi:magnesium-transporting ATPase (P-type)
MFSLDSIALEGCSVRARKGMILDSTCFDMFQSIMLVVQKGYKARINPLLMEPHPALSVLIAIIITILTASFLFSVGYAAFEEPEYEEYCGDLGPYPNRIGNATQEEIDAHEQKMRECNEAYNAANERVRNLVFFIVSGLGLVLILGALAIRTSTVNLTFYIISGIVFGGLVAILISTMQNWSTFARLLRLFILLIEIALVIFVAYRLFSPKRSSKRGKR